MGTHLWYWRYRLLETPGGTKQMGEKRHLINIHHFVFLQSSWRPIPKVCTNVSNFADSIVKAQNMLLSQSFLRIETVNFPFNWKNVFIWILRKRKQFSTLYCPHREMLTHCSHFILTLPLIFIQLPLTFLSVKVYSIYFTRKTCVNKSVFFLEHHFCKCDVLLSSP